MTAIFSALLAHFNLQLTILFFTAKQCFWLRKELKDWQSLSVRLKKFNLNTIIPNPFSLVPNVVNCVKKHCKFDPRMIKNKFPTLPPIPIALSQLSLSSLSAL